MDYKHPDVRGAYERTFARPDDSSIIFPEERFLQAADLNDMRGILGRRVERAARLSARDGDRRTGAAIRVLETGDVDLQAGEIFAGGDVLPVTAAVLSGVPMVGAALIGVRLVKTYIDADEDAGLLGLAPGTLAEGEPGALREVTTLSWGFEGDGADGELYPVYRLKDGVPLNQQSAELSETAQAVALADFGAHGSYIVEGCGVTALGRDDAGAQQFDIGAGTASIGGFYRTRASALRHSEVESWTTRQIDGEQHVFTAGDNGQCELRLFEGPIDQIVQVLLERETTKTITRGQTSGGADNLGETSVLSVVSLKQGNKTYTEGADFTLSGHKISWAIAGDEPAKGSSYEVQFRFRDVVVPAAVTANSITLSGGRDGGEVIATYQVKQARTDLVCLDREGQPVYLRGLAGSGEPPRAPDGLLRLAEVHNDFAGTPRVENNGPGRYTMQDIGELASLLYRQLDALALAQSRQRLADREPPARYGIFADAHVDDRFRDAGAVQTLASSGGVLALALTPTVHNLALQTVATLPYTLEPIVEQPLKNDCVKINRFANFEPDPAEIEVTPASDFWVDVREEWASQRTRTIRGGGPRTVSSVEQLGAREEPASFIRAQTLAIDLTRMAAGERLETLEFDGVDMTPAGDHVADEDGALQIALQIPAHTFPTGEKLVRVTGMAGSWAEASFTARGRTLVQMRRRVITRFEQVPRRVRRRRNDPRGQIVILPEQGRHLGAFWVEFCAIGDKAKPVVCELRAVGGDGDVLDEVLAQTQVDMSTVSAGNWTQFVFADLPYLPRDRRYALCLLTGDNDHAISRAIVGNAVDFNDQIRVTKNAYALGNEVESSTGSSWNHLHDSDLKFALQAPRFTQLETRISLGMVALTACSDLLIRAAVELPEAGCSVHFEVERASGELLVLEADTPLQLDAFLDEHVEVFAVLKGTATASPVLMPGVQLIASQLASSGQYVSRAFKVGGADSLPVRVDARLPVGAGAKISLRDKAGGWVELPQTDSEPLDLPGWQDLRFSADLTGQLGQMSAVKIEMTGTPAARPYIAATRAAAI